MKKKISNDNKVFIRRALISGGMMLSSYLMKQLLESGYRKVSGRDAPKNPGRRDVGWGQALLWGVATGAVLGAAKTVLRTGLREKVDKLLED